MANTSINLRMKDGNTVVLNLPAGRYTSDQWINEVCETLQDAKEVKSVEYFMENEDE